MKFARVGAAIAAAAIVVTACGGTTGGAGKDLKIGITLPLSGSALASAGPADKGARLAIKEFALEGYTVAPDVKDHAVNGVHDPQQGAKDMTAFAADPASLETGIWTLATDELNGPTTATTAGSAAKAVMSFAPCCGSWTPLTA